MIERYVNTASTAGGDGTTNATSGSTRAFATLRECIDSLGTSLSDHTRIWCEGSTADTGDVYQTPWDMTTTATNYLEIIGEQSPRHANFSLAKSGKYDTTLYRLERTNSHVLYNNLPAHVIWDGLQAKCTANDASNYNCFRTTNANQSGSSGFFQVRNCIAVGVVSGGSTVYGFQPGVQGAGGICKTWNCIAIDCSQGFVGAGTGHEFWNCTAADCATSGFTEDAACVVKNCLSKGASVGFIGTFTGSSNNAEDDGNGAPGTNSRTAQTFTFVDAANNDFHLASTDAGAKGYGIADPGSGDFSDDIDGQTRGATWDIGFDQYIDPPQEQEGFRWGVDDGSESAHTWEAAQDTNITITDTQSRLLRVLVNAQSSDPAAAAYTLRYQKNGSGGYAAVPVGATGYTPISYVGGQANGRAGSTSTTAVTFAFTGGSASVPAAGDLVVIALSTGSTVDRDLAISGYTEITGTDIYADDTIDTNLAVFYKFMGGTPDTTVTIPSTGSIADAQRWDIRCFRNVDASTPIDVSAVTATGINSRLANPGSITPTTTGAVVYVVGAAAGGTGGTFTNSNSLTAWLAGNSVDTQDAMMGAGYYTGWTSGAYDPAAFTGGGTDTTSDSWAAVCVALRPVTFSNEVYITISANITAGGEATTARLTAPSGKSTSDYVTGRRWDDENGTDTINITSDDYTEVEWLVALSSAPVDTDYFEFRVYAGAAALSTYTLTPKWTVGTAGTTVTPGAASLTLTTFAPTVTTTANHTVTPGSASLTLTAFAPSVVVNTIVTPGAASLTLSTFAPTVTASSNVTVTPGSATLALTGFAPTVTVSSNVTVIPGTASLSLSTFSPVVTASNHQTVIPGTAALTLTTFAPTVSVSSGLTLVPGTATLTLATFAPVVTATAHQLVTPATATLTLTTFAPTVTVASGSVVVTPGTAALTLTTYAPMVISSSQHAPISGNPGKWAHVWKRATETKHHQTDLALILTIQSRIVTTRATQPTKPAASDEIMRLKREVMAEAEAFLRDEEARQRAAAQQQQEEERRQRQQQQDDDEAVVMAASVLLRAHAPRGIKTTIRGKHGRRSE